MDKRDIADRLLDEAIADLRGSVRDETLSPSCRASIVEEAVRAESPAPSGVRLIARWALVFGAVPVAAAAFLLIALAPEPDRHAPELVSAEKQGESVVFTIADGSGSHRVLASTNPGRFDGAREMRSVGGEFTVSASEEPKLVFYKID